MKKLGFTLAEVLITLAILGVIAAITLPGLNRNVAQQQIGPKLAKAINNLENANQTIINDYNVRLIDEVTALPGVEGTPSYPQILESVLAANLNDDGDILTGKDGIAYKFTAARPTTTKSSNIANLSRKYNGNYYTVTIDIDGVKASSGGSDKGGSDQFLVYVDRAGIVLPAGGTEAYKYSSKLTKATNCTKSGKPDEKCTAAIVEAGWKVPY